jgi:hypothetical protein
MITGASGLEAKEVSKAFLGTLVRCVKSYLTAYYKGFKHLKDNYNLSTEYAKYSI